MSLFGPPNVDRLKTQRDVEGLIKALGYQKDWRPRLHAVKALGEIGDTRAVEPLITALNNDQAIIREAAAKALGEIGDSRAVEPLITALEKSGNPSIQEDAAWALGKLGDPRAVEPLIGLLKINDVGEMAAWALGKIGDPRAVDSLIDALLTGKQSVLCWNAADALGDFSDSRALESLNTILKNSTDNIMLKRATEALDKISNSGSQATNLKQQLASVQSEILRFLTSERTRQYEREQNAYWSLGDLVLVITKTGMHRDWGEVSVTDMVVDVLIDMYRQGKIRFNPSFVSSNNVEVNAKFIYELQTETQPLFRAN